ncbi:MAG TPA: APC family permease [Firmicutes bacterium]|nr:APC family permease [Bacillota bacterium]
MKKKNERGILRQKDIFLGMICAMFFLDTVGPVASMGASSITWSVIISLIFLFPSGLIMAEMGSSYPADGGMYAWVKKAYGPKWGARMSWLYWINNAIWTPSTCIFTISVFCQVFLGEVPFLYQLLMSIALIWCIILFSLRSRRTVTRFTNLAAFFKIFIAAAMVLMAILFLLQGNAPANNISLQSFRPQLNDTFLFLSALIYNYLGFEVMFSVGSQIKNPTTSVPRATIANTFMISTLYIFVLLAIIIIVPQKDTSIVDTIMNCFLFANLSPAIEKGVVLIIGSIFLAILFAQEVTWMIGAGRLAAGAAKDHELPMAFGKQGKSRDIPVGALIMTGIVGTVTALIYGLIAHNTEDLFWTLFSFTNIIFLLPYIINFQAYIKLRKINGKIPGAYHIWGPTFVGTILARLEQGILIATIGIILLTPGRGLELTTILPLLGGTMIVLIIGEILINRCHLKYFKQSTTTTE